MNYLLVILIIGLVILAHEFGHFWAARRAGIPIRVFSLGLGPTLWARTWKATEYRLCLIPLGGYVLPDVRDEEEFLRLPVNKRIMLSAGGPTANVVLALLRIGLPLYVTVMDVGRLYV